MLNIKNVFIEGPDCSGKTTLIDAIHKKTGYRYHIHDRSQLSRSIFANLYKRDIPNIEIDLKSELFDMNNVYIVLLPPWPVVRERFQKRGDEKHDIKSLREVYIKFQTTVNHIYNNLPNVYVCCESEKSKLLGLSTEFLNFYQESCLKSISNNAYRIAKTCKNKEAVNLKFSIFPHKDFPNTKHEIMSHEKEGEYYRKIYEKVFKKIKSELKGNNEYNREETELSRRFIYTDDTCISLIHIMIRDKTLNFNCVIRSSNVKDILYYDLEFLYFLCYSVKSSFFSNIKKVHMKFELNSAHILC